MKICPRRKRWTQGVLLLAVLALFFILPSFMKEPSTKPSRCQCTEKNKENPQEMLQKAIPRRPIMELPPRVRDKEKTSVRTEELGLQNQDSEAARADGEEKTSVRTEELGLQNQDSEAARADREEKTSVRTEELGLQNQDSEAARADGEEKRKKTTWTALGKHQSKKKPAAKTLVPESRGKMLTATGALFTRLKKKLIATGAVPAKDKKAQANPSPASFPHPTTQRGQRLKASNFKSEPRWDFEEEYSLDVGGLQTTCPDSLKIRASKSPRLQNIFLPNLTLFLDSGHFTQSEWDRLEHFAPPFGFMELNQSLVEKVVTRFPPVPQQQLLLASLPSGNSSCITCAVVGNGGILNDSHVGQEIDSHDYVFRLSGALIKGYEQDVGTRTSFYGFTAFSLVQSILTLGRRGFQHVPLGKDVRYLHFLEGTRDYEWLEAMFLNQTLAKTKLSWFRHRPQEAFRDALDMDRYLLLHPDFIRYMKNRFLRSKTLDTARWRIYRPTTGALLLLTALHLCDKVSAYGFITQGHERFSDHYYDKSWKRLVFYINHDFKLEKVVWKLLHDEGIIRLYQRPENPKEKN